MRLWLESVRITCIRLVRNRVCVLCALLLLPVVAVCCLLLRSGAPVASVRAGIVFSPENKVALDLYNSLPQSPEILFTAYTPERRGEVEHLVRTGTLDCAYILEDALQDAVLAGDLSHGITLLKSPASIADTLLGELLFSSVLEASSHRMTLNQVAELFGVPPNEAEPEIAALMERFGAEGQTFTVQQPRYLYSFGNTTTVSPIAARTLHGVIALFSLLAVLLALPCLISSERHGLWRRLATAALWRYHAGMGAALWAVASATGALGLLPVWALYPAALTSLPWEILCLAAYAACLSAAALLCVVLLDSAGPLYAAAIFVLLLAVTLGGVLVDWGEINRALGAVASWLPTTRYLDAALHHTASPLLRLFGAASLLLLAVACRLWLYQRRFKL